MGWLGHSTIVISSLTGVWEPLIVATVFAAAWTGIRTVEPEVAMTVGYAFDLAIPLEYQCECSSELEMLDGLLKSAGDPLFSQKHAVQLEYYWMIFGFASAVETAGYFMIDENFFTMCVCLKTVLLVVTWASTSPDGSSVSSLPFSQTGVLI